MVCLSVCLSVVVVNSAKTAEPIKIRFGLSTRVGPRNHVLDSSPDAPREGAIVRGRGHYKVWAYHLCAATMRPVVKLL